MTCRDHFVYSPSQWETPLHCIFVSHWVGAYTKWSQDMAMLSTVMALGEGNPSIKAVLLHKDLMLWSCGVSLVFAWTTWTNSLFAGDCRCHNAPATPEAQLRFHLPCVAFDPLLLAVGILLIGVFARTLIDGHTLAVVQGVAWLAHATSHAARHAVGGHQAVEVGTTTLAQRGTLGVDHTGWACACCKEDVGNMTRRLFNSLTAGRPGSHFKTAIFNFVLLIVFFRSSNDNAPIWMSWDLNRW